MNTIDLAKRVALVTGGAQGIGFAAAKRMALSGAKLALWDIDEKQLAKAQADLGGETPPPPKPAEIEGLDDADDQEGALRLAVDLENALLRAYLDVVEAADSPALLKTVTEISMNAAQHLVVLRQQLGEPPLPEAFETGKPNGV